MAAAFAALMKIDGSDPTTVLELLTDQIVGLSLATACTAHLVDEAEELQVVAARPEHPQVEQLGDLQRTDGPSLEALQSRQVRTADDLERHRTRWPSFAPQAGRAGFRSAQALPLHGSDRVLGVVTALYPEPATHEARPRADIVRDLVVAAAARVADQQALAAARTEVEQLSAALYSRVLIEQAKGMLAGANGGSPEQGFELLRRYARNHNRVLSEVAQAVVTRSLEITDRDLPG